MFDTILVEKSYTEGNFAYEWSEKEEHIAEATGELNLKLEEAAKKLNINLIKGNTLCNDCFDGYLDDIDGFIARFPKELNIIACEMEAFALFYMARYFKRNAACLLTVVDSHYKNQESTPEERERSLNDMIKVALESI